MKRKIEKKVKTNFSRVISRRTMPFGIFKKNLLHWNSFWAKLFHQYIKYDKILLVNLTGNLLK